MSGVAWVLVALILTSGVVSAIIKGLDNRPDWDSWQGECRYAWDHRRTANDTRMFGYLPATVLALSPFTIAAPRPVGVVLFSALNLAAAVGSIWIVYRWWIAADQHTGSFVWPVLLVSFNFQHVLQGNQLTLFALFFCVAGLALVARGRQFYGGAGIGLAVLFKAMPLFLLGYLLLRKKWLAVAGLLTGFVVFDFVPTALFFGPRGAIAEHRAWAHRAAGYSNTRQIEDPLRTGAHRHHSNFSYSAVLARWLRGIPPRVTHQIVLYGDPPAKVIDRYRRNLKNNEWLTLDPAPPRDRLWGVDKGDVTRVPRFRLARLSTGAVWWIWAVSLLIILAALAWTTWRTGDRGSHDWAPTAALWMLVMFFPSPMMRHYYLALAFPAIAVVWRALSSDRRHLPRGLILLGVAAMVVWVIGVVSLGNHLLRWYGIHLAAIAVLAAATAAVWRHQYRKARYRP